MAEFSFNGQLKYSSKNWHQKMNKYMTTLKIDAEWSLICLWSDNNLKPAFLEIRSFSTAKEILISGNFKLTQNGTCILQRKFVQLIEAGFETTLLALEYSGNTTEHYFSYNEYFITGTLKVSAHTADNKSAKVSSHSEDKGSASAKGVQFKSLLDLSDGLECLLDPKSTCFSDNCGAVSFPAHKNILSARSSVFAAMFSSQMKESRDHKVNISDLSPQVLKTMLTYIYTGKTGELSAQSAGELLFAADKYELQDLKRVCSDHLKSCVSVENALRTLVLGYFHDKDLKVFAIDFFCNSIEEFQVLEKKAEWKNLREKIPSLAMDVLTGMVVSKEEELKRYK